MKQRRRTAGRRHGLAATIAAGLIAAITYLAFAGVPTLGGEFELRGVFSNANQLSPGSPVRLAGVQIGEVKSVEPGPDGASTVTMSIDDPDLLRADARLSVRPRLLFEGNFYVAAEPGTPGAPSLSSGATIPRERTDAPVQLDQLLSSLTAPAREGIRSSLAEFAAGFGGGDEGQPGYEGARRATRALDGALADLRTAARAAQGTEAGDARRALGGAANLSSELGREPDQLAGLVTGFNRTVTALAAESGDLGATVRELDNVLRAAPTSLTALNRALPTVTRFANRLRPALRVAPESLTETAGLLGQLGEATRPSELPALVGAASLVAANLPAVEAGLEDAFSLVTPAARCVTENVLPVLNTEVPDGPTSSGRPAWQDLMHMAANLTQTSPGFDGNGGTLRISIAESENALVGVLPGIGEIIGAGLIQGLRPVWLGPGVEPEFRPDQWCADQELPDLDARSRPGLPPGFATRPIAPPSDAARERQGRIAELLFGSRADRRSLLRWLLSELPSLGGPERQAVAPPAAPDPAAPPQLPPAGAPAPPEQTPAPQSQPGAQAPPRTGLGGALQSLLDLIGRGGRR